MNYTSSRSTRRIIGRLSKGESLIASLQRLCKRERVRAGAVRGIGLLRNVELQTYSAEKRRYETTLSGTTSFELLSLEGNISTLGELIFINSYVHVGTHHLGQWQTFGGLLVEAEAISFEFILDAFEDVTLERRLDDRTGLAIWNKLERVGQSPLDTPSSTKEQEKASAPVERPAPPISKSTSGERATAFSSDGAVSNSAAVPKVVRRPTRPTRAPSVQTVEPEAVQPAEPPAKPAEPPAKPTAPPAKKASKASWSDAVQASKSTGSGAESPKRSATVRSRRAVVEAWPDTPELQIGDKLEHPHFGLCRIVFVEEDEYVKIRTKRGVVDIKLEVCEITLLRENDGHNEFKCKIIPT